MLRTRLVSIIALGASVACYLSIGLQRLDLPGLQYDEAFDAVPAMELLRGLSSSAVSAIRIGGREWPLMMHPHIGPTSTYLSLLAFALGGVSVAVLRTSQLLVGVTTLVLLWLLACTWFDDLVAAVAVALCATSPPFVWWSRAGVNWTAPLLPIALAMMLAITRWWRTRSRRSLLCAAFLLGAGATTKVLYLWLLAPLVLTGLVALGRGGVARELRAVSASDRIAAGVALAAGLLPLIVYNVITLGGTLQYAAANALHTRLYGHDNLAFVSNLEFVVREFVRTMGGNTGAFPSVSGGNAAAILFAASLLYLVTVWARRRADIRAVRVPLDPATRLRLRPSVFLVVAVLTIIPLSTVTTSTLSSTYLFILVPFAWLLVAVALVSAARTLASALPFGSVILRRFSATAIVLIVTLAFGISHWRANARIQEFVATTGGIGVWSDSIMALAHRLERDYASWTPIAMDWGFKSSVELLTEGRVRMHEGFEYSLLPSDDYGEQCEKLLRSPSNLYVFHAPGSIAFDGYREILERTAERRGKRLELLETLRRRDGVPSILLFSAS